MSYHDEVLSEQEEKDIAVCIGGIVLCWWIPLPFIAGIVCDYAEKKLIKTILVRNNIEKNKVSKIIRIYRLRNPFLWIGTYIPYIGIPCQLTEVKRLTKYTMYLINNHKLK